MTNGIAVASVAVFLVTLMGGMIDQAAVMGGFIPARITGPDPLAGLMAVPAWLTPISCTLLHAGWLHIGFNMLMLVFCGRQVEHVFGKWPTLLLYGVGAYGASLAQWLVDPAATAPMVGASGAISAILGAYALLYSRQEVKRVGPFSANIVRIAWLAAAWIVVQLMLGVATAGGLGDIGRIAIAAHVGGFLTGLILTRPLLRWRFRKRPHLVQ